MADLQKRGWKLQDFLAHVANVNALALGRKSSRVLATGGDDKKINLWTVAKPTCIICLSGHTSAVHSVAFGENDESLAAGSASGSIKIWDLEAAKLLRALPGHQSNVQCLDFHPFGKFVASGSLDTQVKLWDVMRRGCIFTYKDHTAPINAVSFSPDGKWLATAGADSAVKIWDLRKGKILANLEGHVGAVNALAFHPRDYYLATAGQDRCIRFWDLETFQLSCTTDPDTCTAIRSIEFHPEGAALYAGSQELLKVYRWEPARCVDTLNMQWGKVASMRVTSSSSTHMQLVAASFNQQNVSTYCVEVNELAPLSQKGPVAPPPENHASVPHEQQRPPTKSRRNYDPPTHDQDAQVKEEPEQDPEPQRDDEATDEAETMIQNAEDHAMYFKTPVAAKGRQRGARPASGGQSQPRQPPPFSRGGGVPRENDKPDPAPFTAPQESTSVHSMRHTPSQPVAVATSSETHVHHPAPGTSSSRPAPASSRQAPPTRPQHQAAPPQQKPVSSLNAEASIIPTDRQNQPTIDVGDFMAPPASEGASELGEADAYDKIMRGHKEFRHVIETRKRNLDIVRAHWDQPGSVRPAAEAAVRMNDLSVMLDLLTVLNLKRNLWDLAICAIVLPDVHRLLASKYETYVTCALDTTRLILKNFTRVIRDTLEAASGGRGVDVAAEDRYRRAAKCEDSVLKIKAFVTGQQQAHGPFGSKFREIKILLDAFR